MNILSAHVDGVKGKKPMCLSLCYSNQCVVVFQGPIFKPSFTSLLSPFVASFESSFIELSIDTATPISEIELLLSVHLVTSCKYTH